MGHCVEHLDYKKISWVISGEDSCTTKHGLPYTESRYVFHQNSKELDDNRGPAVLYTGIMRPWARERSALKFLLDKHTWEGEFFVFAKNGHYRRQIYPSDSLMLHPSKVSRKGWEELFIDFYIPQDSLVQFEFIAISNEETNEGYVAIDNFYICGDSGQPMISTWGLVALGFGLAIFGAIAVKRLPNKAKEAKFARNIDPITPWDEDPGHG